MTRPLLLVVVAHPDDESFGCGSVLLHAAAMGFDTAVLCATRGDSGESRLDTDDLGTIREAELRQAARMLGVGDVRLLEYGDSGMSGGPAPLTLAAAPLEDVTEAVREVIDDLRPRIVVTLDASDGHRDHVVMREATLAAVDTSAHPPQATYLSCLARSLMVRWAERMRATGGGDAYLALASLGTPDEEITTTVDVVEHLPKRWEAIRLHESQASPYDDLPEDLQRDFLGADQLQLVRGSDIYPR